MNQSPFDVVVVGARCAGSPLAMLLARLGHRVLAVDKATFPSDTISTHLIHPPGVAALERWGLLDRLVATGCPPIHTYMFDFGPFRLEGPPGTAEAPVAYAPRRTVLDALLVGAARAAGAEVREACTVDGLVFEDGAVAGIRGHDANRVPFTERARVVVGADGLHSLVAREVDPEPYHEMPPLLAGYYTYWSGLPMDGRFETYILPRRGFGVWPTHDDLTLIVAGWPYDEFEANRHDVEGNYMQVLERVPAFAERVRGAERVERFQGMAVPNYFRRPFGPGWALLGDAGYNKDFITAQGISDAFLDAERVADRLDAFLGGHVTFDDAMSAYQAARDQHVRPMYEYTAQLATLEPPPPEVQQLLAATSTSRAATDAYIRVNSGVTSPAEFFSPENMSRILSRAGGGG